jgi:peptidoglycan/LPS O-acetylase OafA/YrhL
MTVKQPHLSHPKYRPDIDGLRAVAVLAVVAFHAFPSWVRGGFIGVDVFFVISGYLISTIIFDNLDKGTFSFTEFYSSRIRRIFPALLLVLIACYAFGWLALLADEYKQLGKHIAAGAGFISNFTLWNEAGYFDNSAETKPLLHLWSLGIEEQFYIIWPLLLWFAWKRKFNLLTITIVVAIASFVLNIKGIKHDMVATFYSPQTRFWELLSGSLLAWITLYKKDTFANVKLKLDYWLSRIVHSEKQEADGKMMSNVLSFIGLLLLVYGFWRINKELSFPGKWALVPVLGAVLIITAGSKAWVNRTILSNKVAVWFGLISYPLYLWHWPILSFARIIESEVPSRNIRIAAVVLSILLAWLTYKLVERPLRFGNYSKVKVTVLVFLMTIVGYVGYNTYDRDGLKFRASIQNLNSINSEFVGPLWQYTKNNICQTKYPLVGSEKYGWWFCMSSSEEKPTLLILGNSYANHFYPGIVLNQELNKHSVLSIGTCDAAWVDESKLTTEINYYPCSGTRPLDQLKLINNLITKEKSIKFVIVGGLSPTPTSEYIFLLKRRIDFLESNGIKVILFTPHVKIDYDIKGCYSRPLATPKKDCRIPIKAYNDLKQSFKPLVESIKKTNPKVLFFDQNIIFCDGDNCNFKLPIMPAFRDEYAHLSSFSSKLLFDRFVDWAKDNVPEILNY